MSKEKINPEFQNIIRQSLPSNKNGCTWTIVYSSKRRVYIAIEHIRRGWKTNLEFSEEGF